jgi:transcriptional regulator with GAF, ATPase, and Fis domain
MLAPALRPFIRLHGFTVLRDLIRKWWRLELFLVDSAGEAVPDGRAGSLPRPIAPDNDFCRLSLHAPEGARRCAESLRVTLDKARDAGRSGLVVHACHLDFAILAHPLYLDGALAGYVAVSGLRAEPLSDFAEVQLLRKIREAVPAAGNGTDIERAVRRVPILAQVEIEQLGDLLHLCAAEIQAHHEASRGRAADPDLLVGASLPMQALLRQIEKANPSATPVLITGEPGSGKERVARLIHAQGAPGPFVIHRCATTAAAPPLGAADGTLLLDEIDALPLAAQEALLKAPALRAGGPRILATAAAVELLQARCAAGAFLPDLLRAFFPIAVPPLRERPDDIPLLCAHFLRRHGARPLPPSVLASLTRYPWPGNVRELEAEIGRLCMLAGPEPGAALSPDLLSPRILEAGAAA